MRDVWLWAFSNCDGVQVLWGRAGLFRLPVIPSPSCGGHGAVRWQHAGSIKRATTPSGGQTDSGRARVASGVLTLPCLRSSARMWPSRSP